MIKNSNKNNNNINRQYYSRCKKILLPCIKDLSEGINNHLRNTDIIQINKITNTLKPLIILLGKDIIPTYDKANNVYKINCANCPSTYIGQSKRYFKLRLSEHQRDVLNNSDKSAIAKHVSSTGHKINFEKVQVIDNEPFKRSRLFYEMLNIHFHDDTMNRINDTQFLKNEHKSFINNAKHYL